MSVSNNYGRKFKPGDLVKYGNQEFTITGIVLTEDNKYSYDTSSGAKKRS
jgi:hypothetical protein